MRNVTFVIKVHVIVQVIGQMHHVITYLDIDCNAVDMFIIYYLLNLLHFVFLLENFIHFILLFFVKIYIIKIFDFDNIEQCYCLNTSFFCVLLGNNVNLN